jgi:hypothetical protein
LTRAGAGSGAACAAWLLALVLAPACWAGWSRTVRLSGPQGLDVQPPEVALGHNGAAAVAFGVQDEDNPAFSDAFTLTGTPAAGFTRPRRVPGALAVLAVEYDPSGALEELTGTSRPGLQCCATAAVRPWPGRGRPTTLVRGLTGTTDGQLVPLENGQLLAAVATQRGVWVAQSRAGRFAAARRVHFGGALTDLAAAALPRGGGLVAWATASGGYGAGARRILVSWTATGSPSPAQVAVTVPVGHTVDELALAPGTRTPAVAWIESWYDARGARHSVAQVRDIGGARVRTISQPFELASDLTLAGDGAGDQVLAFDGCSAAGTCVARAAIRRARGGFGPPQRLGAIDPSQAVAATVTGAGAVLVGWVGSGHVVAAEAGPRWVRFGRARTISSTNYGSDLTIAPGPRNTAFAAWTQGTFSPIVVGSWFR